jgi:hypothetical protein
MRKEGVLSSTKHARDDALNYMTKKREMVLKDLGYQYKCIWEHECNRQLKNDAAMREYISNLDITDRLNPRDSLYGGRTNAIQLFHEIQQPGETMEYYDFTRYVCVFCTSYSLFFHPPFCIYYILFFRCLHMSYREETSTCRSTYKVKHDDTVVWVVISSLYPRRNTLICP